MKIKEIHPAERPREKLIKLGADRLKHEELLAIIINTGVKGKNALELSTELLRKYSLAEFLGLDYKQLIKLTGINQAKACKILSIRELISRNQETKANNTQITDSKTASIFFEELKQLRKEKLMVIYLNIHNELIWKEIITVGTVDSTSIHPREVYEPAIKYLASSIIMAHNHPSGNTQPSVADLEVTKQISEAGQILGINLLDHLIVSKEGFFSFKDNNLL